MPENETLKLKALTDIASININSDFDEILKNILKITCRSMNAHSGTIMLHDEQTDEIRIAAQYGLPEDYIERVYRAANEAGMPISSSPSGTVFKTCHYYIVPDISKEPKDKPWLGLSRKMGFTAQIFTPLMRGMKVAGLLNVYMSEEHHFTEEEIDFVTLAAHQASTVVHNARMCSKLKQNVEELNEYKVHLEDKLKESHKKLFLSENYLRSIIESSFDGIFVVDNEGRVEFGNNAFFRIINHLENEIIGHTFLKVIHPDYHDFILQRWQEVQRGEGRPYEVDIVQKDGTVRSLLLSYTEMEIGGEKKYCAIAKDITERNRIEEEARLNSEIFNNVSEGVYILGMEDGLIKHSNSKFEQMFGYNPGEMRGKDVSILNAPTDKTPQETKLEILDFVRKNGEWHGDIKNIRKDGTPFWSYANVSLFDHHQYGRVIVNVHTDITQRKQAEEKLRESEERYRDLFENANDIIYIHDLKGIILNINKMGSQVLGATEKEIIGSNIKEWVSPHSFKIFEDRVRRIFLNQPLEQPVAIEVITRKGEHKWGEATTRLIKDGDKIAGVQGIARDITEKRRLEQELKESEEKYRDLFENAQDAMYVLDNKLNFLKMNRVGIQTLDCTKEEVIGSNISRWVTPESLKIIQERQKKRLSGEKVNPTDLLEVVCKNGKHRWVEIISRVIRSDDGRIEYHGIARDITENRILKQELNKSNKKQKLLCHLIQGTRGGKTRALILKQISDKSYNAHQLATALNLDYKTIRHHLNVLIKNGILGKSNDGSYELYFLLNNMDLDLNG